MRVWGILRTDGKIVRDIVLEFDYKSISDVPDPMILLKDLCYELDLACPVLLQKHRRDLNDFGRAIFKSDDFMEPITFDRFELEILRDKKR